MVENVLEQLIDLFKTGQANSEFWSMPQAENPANLSLKFAAQN